MAMLRRLAAITFAALVFVFPAVQTALADTVLVRLGANIRSEPSSSSHLLDHAEHGDRFELLDDDARRYGYFHIDLGDGRTGQGAALLVEFPCAALEKRSVKSAERVSREQCLRSDEGPAS